jgi:hypothetical protein
MHDIRNPTPFPAQLAPVLDKHGRESAVLAIKGTFAIKDKSDRLAVAEKQVPLTTADEWHGDAEKASLKYQSDLGARKPGTDVSLLGHAYAHGPDKSTVDVALKVGGLTKTVRVFGDRVWFKALGFWVPSESRPFDKMPLVYEKAFGGVDESDENPKKHAWERRNPVGTGFVTAGKDGLREDMPLPNFEDPNDLITGADEKPAPAGFGLIAGHWMPRAGFAGTYDEAWKKNRFPLLPGDFDERFHQAASPGLATAAKLAGGEPVRFLNLAEDRDVSFALPKRSFKVDASLKGKQGSYPALIDSVVIEPDEGRITITWKAVIPSNRDFLYLDRIRISEAA